MADKFKAIVINQEGENFSREIKEVDGNFLGDGDVLVKIDYSDLNYKDALILNNGGKLVKEFPRIPGIDFSGKVVESNTDNFKKDDEVIITGCRVGEISHGGYSQYARVKKDFLVKSPQGISTKQAMILGTAGFTALLCAFAIKAREEIVQPLLTIQQFALIKIKEIEKTTDYSNKYLKTLKSLVTRSLFGNINASRNSA